MVKEAVLSGISNSTDKKRDRVIRALNNSINSAKKGAGATIFRTSVGDGGDFNSVSAVNILERLSMVVEPRGPSLSPGYGSNRGPRNLEEVMGRETGKTLYPIDEYETRRDTRGRELSGISATIISDGRKVNSLEISADPEALAKLRGEEPGLGPKKLKQEPAPVGPEPLKPGILNPRGWFGRKP